ncbi:MAG: hypothetical protein IIZ13_12045 [Renibacterium sp.]|nr:hypothetical protein [Renibacterium sp.]
MKKRIFAVVSIVFVMFFAIVPTASAAGNIVFKEYTDDGKYTFYHPEVCSVSWNSVPSYDGSTVSVACPAGYGFKSFEVIYGSGAPDGTVADNKSMTYDANGQNQTFAVTVAPHAVPIPPALVNSYWTNLKVIPKF